MIDNLTTTTHITHDKCAAFEEKIKELEEKLKLAQEFNEIWRDKCAGLEAKLIRMK